MFLREEAYYASVSRLIKDTCDKKYIKKLEDTAPIYKKYVPDWT